jgi:hypothetical protein
MKTVDDAYFDPDGRHLVAFTRGRFHYYAVDLTADTPLVEKLWDHKLSNGFRIAFGRDVVIASNTSDQHVAISKKTGELMWDRPRPKKDGISGAGIVVDHRGAECYVFTGYKNVFQVSTATGQDLCDPWPIDLWTNSLHDLGDGQVGVIVRAYAGAHRNHLSMAALDLNEQSFTLRCDFDPSLTNPLPAPDGTSCLFLQMGHSPPTVEVRKVPSTKATGSYTVESIDLRPRLAQSPTGRWIGVGTRGGYILLDTNDGRTIELPYGLSFGTPAFHPDDAHVLLPRTKTTKIERIENLFNDNS